MKRTADEVSDLEVPQGSRPMLALDRTRHRPVNPESNLEQQLSGVTRSHTAETSPTASSHPLRSNSTVDSSQPTSSSSGLDGKSPIVQQMLREAFDKGQSEGRQEIQSKLDEVESEVKELRRRLDPAKFKAAYDRGFREGGMKGYEKCSLECETKASEERLAFQDICKEKDLAIYDQQMTMSRYQKELMARKRRIADLEQHAIQQHGQNISSQQMLDAEARFSTQAQELTVAKRQSELMTVDLSNLQAQWGKICADLENCKAAFDIKASQLDAYQRQVDNAALELQESRDQAKQLAATNSEVIGSWKASTKGLSSKLNVLSSDFDSLERLVMTLTKVAAERSAEIKLIKALNEGLKGKSKQVEDGKEEINALTSRNIELAKVRGDLEKTLARQDEELQDLAAEKEELTRKLRKREEEDIRALPNPDNTPRPRQADEEQAERIDDLLAELVPETAAADLELVRVMIERERVNTAAENARREHRITATLERMEETEQRRRQILIDELEVRDAQLYDAQKQITELTEKLLSASPTQPLQSIPSAPSSSAQSPSPSPTQPPPPTAAPSSPPQPKSWFSLRRLVTAAATGFSPRRLLLFLFIFLLAFHSFYLRSPSRPSATEATNNSTQVAIEVLPLPAEAAVSASEADEEMRRQVQAWGMGNWERNERMFRGEKPREGDGEYRPIPGLAF